MKYVLLSIVFFGVLAGCNNSTAEEPAITTTQPTVTETTHNPTRVTTSSALPSFRMMSAGNQLIDLTQFKGKKIFVNLWATWCPPCRAEIPSIESLAAKTDKTKAEFIMLSLDDNFEKAKSFAIKNNMKLPVYYPASTLPQLFAVNGIPVTYIFNEKGEIIYQQVGENNYDTKDFFNLLNK